MTLKCTARIEVEITPNELISFLKQRVKGIDEVGDIRFFLKAADGEVAEVTNDNPLTASYVEISEV